MPHDPGRHVIGLIADTHGLVRYSVHTALAGVELILHAGDVGGPDVLDELGTIAPVLAVYGNTDPVGVPGLEATIVATIGGVSVHVSHGHELGAPSPELLLSRYPYDVLVYGHTHKGLIRWEQNRVVVNPGSAGPRRFNLAPSVARLTIADGSAAVELIGLEDD